MLDAWLPKGAPFYEFLAEQNRIMCSLCALLARALTEGQASKEVINTEARCLEEKGDEMYTVLITSLAQTFITPIDREDILRIGKEQENTIDLVHNLVARLYVFNLDEWPEPIEQIARNLASMAVLTGPMLAKLTARENIHSLETFRALRDECEGLLSYGLGQSLDVPEETPGAVLMTIKLTRAYDRMEQALAQLVELAEAVEEAVLKNV